MVQQALYTGAAMVALLASGAYAATKVGIVGAANPVLVAETEEGVKRELYAGDTVFMGEKLHTSDSGSAQLMFLDRSALMISPNATVKIDKFVYDPATELGEMSVEAGVGAFRFIGGALSKKNPVTIKTPVSTMGIRGGIGDTVVGSDGQTQGVFHHGEAMTMTNADGVTSVTTSPGTGFSQATASARPQPMSQQQVNQRMQNSPVRMASNVAIPAGQGQLQQLGQRLSQTIAPAPTVPEAPAPQTPAVDAPTEPAEPANQAPAPQPPADAQPPEAPQAEAAPTETPQQEAAQAQEPQAQTPQAEASVDDKPQQRSVSEAKLDKPATDAPLTDSEVNDIKTNPKSLLEKFPNGGPEMANHVSRAIATDPTLADSLGDALEGATPAQASAMGTGMVRGARLVAQQDPDAFKELSKTVEKIDNPQVSRTFNAIGPDVDVAVTPPVTPQIITPSVVVEPPLGQQVTPSVRNRALRTPKAAPRTSGRTSGVGGGGLASSADGATQSSPQAGADVTAGAASASIAGAVTTVVAADEDDNSAKSTSPTK